MSSEIFEDNSYRHDLDLLIILHSMHDSYPTQSEGKAKSIWFKAHLPHDHMNKVHKSSLGGGLLRRSHPPPKYRCPSAISTHLYRIIFALKDSCSIKFQDSISTIEYFIKHHIFGINMKFFDPNKHFWLFKQIPINSINAEITMGLQF